MHLAGKDARPWLCVNQVPLSIDWQRVKEGLSKLDPGDGREIKIEGCHRKFSGTLPTTLVLFKVQDDLFAKSITDQVLSIDGKQYKIRAYLDSSASRCTKCQELGNHLSKQCSNPKKCVRCAGPNCDFNNCKKGILLCANCGGGHSAAHKSCPALKTKNRQMFLEKKNKIRTPMFYRLSKNIKWMN